MFPIYSRYTGEQLPAHRYHQFMSVKLEASRSDGSEIKRSLSRQMDELQLLTELKTNMAAAERVTSLNGKTATYVIKTHVAK